MTVHTNFGRSLSAGGEGGTLQTPELPKKCYFIGFKNWRFHHHLCRIEFVYADLEVLGVKLEQDPIVSMITESDLLS